jgi:hypothetical protein
MRVRADGSTWKIQAEGCFEVSEDENDIVEIPVGGWFRAEERRRGRTRRSIDVRRGATGGALVRTYERDGQTAAFDDEAREWMAEALRTVFEHSNFGRDRHIERVLARDGLDGALDEVAAINSDYESRKAYLRLVELRPGDTTLLARAASEASGRIDSSHEMAELVIALAENSHATATTLVAGAEAAQTIDSDYDRRRTLVAILRAPARDAVVAAAVVHRVNDFESDHERCELLREIAEAWTLDAPLARAYFEAVERMGSDYERSRALRAVIERSPLASEIAQGLAEAATTIDSDYHKAEVLLELVDRQALDAPARAACVRAARTIGSDHHRGRVLDALHATDS